MMFLVIAAIICRVRRVANPFKERGGRQRGLNIASDNLMIREL